MAGAANRVARVKLSPAVARCVEIYTRGYFTSTRRPRNYGWRLYILGGRLQRLSVEEQDQYYTAIVEFRDALRRAEKEIEWPTTTASSRQP